MLYQLTTCAAQLYATVTTVASSGWADWLNHWQTLLGAAVGGLMGVVGALTVSGTQHRREQRIAAGMVLPDLQQLIAAADKLEQLPVPFLPDDIDQLPISARLELEGQIDQRRKTIIQLLNVQRPALFALHTPVIGQLTDVDARLYSHLFQCEMIHRQFEGSLVAKQMGRNPYPSDRLLYNYWRLCAEHAELAHHYLDRLVFARWPKRCMYRLRMKWWPNDIERRSMNLLRTGKLPEDVDARQ